MKAWKNQPAQLRFVLISQGPYEKKFTSSTEIMKFNLDYTGNVVHKKYLISFTEGLSQSMNLKLTSEREPIIHC